MKRGFAGIRLVVFVSLLGLTNTLWGVPQRPSYVVLLDVSGSMEREGPVRYARYSSGQMSNLVRQLGVTIAAADPDAQVTVQPFSSSKERYPSSAEVPPSELGSLVPRTAAGLETELDYALKTGMNNRPNLLLFMITDNQNDFRGSKSDQDFYQLLAKDASIHTVYFVPLANTSNAKDALVLYAIASGSASRSTLRYVTNDFARSQHSEAVQFRGFYDDKEQETLRFAQHILLSDETGDERPVAMEGDAIVLLCEEDEPFGGTLKFRVHSNLQHWRIVDGELRKADGYVDVPYGYAQFGHYKLPFSLSGPRKLNVLPGGDSAEIYALPLSSMGDAGVSLERASLFRTRLTEIPGRIHLEAVVHVSPSASGSGIRPDLSADMQKRIRAVRNLAEIMNLMTFQPDQQAGVVTTERVIPVNREMLIRVAPNAVKNILAWAVEFGLPLHVIAGVLLLVATAGGAQYSISELGGDSRTVKLGMTNRTAPVLWKGKRVAQFQKYGQGVSLRAEPGFEVQPVVTSRVPARFEVTNLKSGDKGQFEVRRGTAPARAAAQRGRL